MDGADVGRLADTLLAEARGADERRVLVLAGDPAACDRALGAATAVLPADSVVVADRDPGLARERLELDRADTLLGTTRGAVVLDCHDACRPNVVGQAVGAVDGGGLLVLLTPPLDRWPAVRDGFDRGIAAPPADVSEVTGRFRRRLVRTLRAHRGVAVVDADAGRIEDDGLTDPPPRRPADAVEIPPKARFPRAAYEACLTGDQADAVAALEALLEPPAAVVLTADRGRGKSSAAGLAAAALALDGEDVLVTAPAYRNASELFARARELLERLGTLAVDGDPPRSIDAGDGRIRFAEPTAAASLPGDPGIVVVDEAAALPVGLLDSYLAADGVVYATTVRGYEGSGRGFDVRFRDRLAASRHDVTRIRMTDPIRYAAGDPVEAWVVHALALDARPAVDRVVEDATDETASYERVDRAALAADDNRLRELFGLLVAAHYRTEPDDLARVLDAPNVSVRTLVHRGHPVSVAVLAEEGDLDPATRSDIYEGGRIRGNMLPDVFASQLREEDAPALDGVRVMRIATHHAARSRGLGSALLEAVRGEFAGRDWLGVGYGATPELLSFWAENGFSTVSLSTTRNDTSGEYSAMMLAPLSERGRRLHDRHAAWFASRAPALLGDTLVDLEADVAVAALRACDTPVDLALSERDWRLVAGAAYGPALYDVDPRPFRRIAIKQLVDPVDPGAIADRQRRLLVRKVLQARPWDAVADELGYHSTGQCMRALGNAYKPLVDACGNEAAREERARYTDG